MAITAEPSGFDGWLAHIAAATEQYLSAVLAAVPAAAPATRNPPAEQLPVSEPLAQAMRDSVLGGGKRLRPAMVFAVAEEISEKSLAAAAAVELIHCYSLVHDDLPCMDNADSRRGRASCHRAHGEAMALLAGDCLQSLAFESAAAVSARACALLAKSAGAAGMGGGQALDIVGVDDDAAQAAMCRLKTGALFSCAVQLGFLCRETTADSAADSAALIAYADEFGLLFQIANDIQGAQADAAAGKKTYATAYPKDAHQKATNARDNAVAALGGRFPRLVDLAVGII